ncbi:LD-carboxypeptidase LdcB/DacB [Streptococcus catagoni]|uniref:LD-carboxypeptidase LdcB/DacB n=1 Tax=Streptococcus catagoni TaxID=2654874 RepID=UPI001408FC7F|nr:LD-carboxypeptidase LdcB/DacB [Streptococcus catagoni]
MKPIKYLTLISLIFLLTACHLQEGFSNSANAKIQSLSRLAKKPNTASSKTVAVKYNGSFYSIPGKYSDIIIVNKSFPLSKDYNPGENPQAKSAFLKLKVQMKKQGFALSDQYSGFRSYETQSQLYENYVIRDGKENADLYSARPGYSEHQTGLAFDLIDSQGNLLEEKSASDWLFRHAPDYGFIVRYLPEKEKITGYRAESWHIRYIGKEASEIAHSGKTLEEYLGIKGGYYKK